MANQQICLGEKLLADVGAVWRLGADGKWKQSAFTIMTATPTPKENTVNDGADFAGGSVLPRKLVVPGGEATFPVIVMKDVKLQEKVDKLLAEECKACLDAFFKGEADMAFKVLCNDKRLLSLQLISGKQKFRHHHVHLHPQTGDPVKLEQILNTKDKDLLPLLRLLNSNPNVILEHKLPSEWYIEGDKLFLVQNICGNDEAAGYALGNLRKFLLDEIWIPEAK